MLERHKAERDRLDDAARDVVDAAKNLLGYVTHDPRSPVEGALVKQYLTGPIAEWKASGDALVAALRADGDAPMHDDVARKLTVARVCPTGGDVFEETEVFAFDGVLDQREVAMRIASLRNEGLVDDEMPDAAADVLEKFTLWLDVVDAL